MSKMLLNLFNFNAAKQFLDILQFAFNDSSVEGNLFSHSSNPLLVMCLLYELLLMIIKKFFSLNNNCKQLMNKIIEMSILFIDSVDDENFLTTIMLERDFSGRDSLRTAVELELLDLIQAPKVEAIIKRIYNSDFEQSGNLFEMCTSYQVCFGNKNQNADIEDDYRFYKKRMIDQKPQSEWLYEIFEESMNARIKAIGMLGAMYVLITCVFYEVVIQAVSNKTPVLEKISALESVLINSGNLTEINLLLNESDRLYESIKDDADTLYAAFLVIEVLCVLNISFFFQHIVTFIFTKKLNRFYEFPTLMHFTDLILAISSVIVIDWFRSNIQKGLYSDPNLSDQEYKLRIMANFEMHLDYKFEYLFSISITCLILRIAVVLQFNEKIGPLIKIVGKLSTDFSNFFLIYVILTIMFAIVGNINFMNELEIFEGFFQSFLTVIDASLGNYDFGVFHGLINQNMVLFGEIYLMCLVLIFNILLLNFIIAILSNTYNIFDNRSNGLYLSKILSTRDELNYDHCYGAFLSAMPPVNIV